MLMFSPSKIGAVVRSTSVTASMAILLAIAANGLLRAAMPDGDPLSGIEPVFDLPIPSKAAPRSTIPGWGVEVRQSAADPLNAIQSSGRRLGFFISASWPVDLDRYRLLNIHDGGKLGFYRMRGSYHAREAGLYGFALAIEPGIDTNPKTGLPERAENNLLSRLLGAHDDCAAAIAVDGALIGEQRVAGRGILYVPAAANLAAGWHHLQIDVACNRPASLAVLQSTPDHPETMVMPDPVINQDDAS